MFHCGSNPLDSNPLCLTFPLTCPKPANEPTMKASVFSSALFLGCLTAGAFAADDADNKTGAKQDAPPAAAPGDDKSKAAKPSPPPSSAATAVQSDKEGKAAPPAPAAASAQKDATAKDPAKEAAESPTVLAPVEVKRNRLIEHDRQILDLQDEIARENKKTKSTETDQALNNAKVSSTLSIFGGSSSESREELAKERVSLMEAELGLLETMDRVKTQAERDDLQKQANELRDMRRNLEHGPSK